MGATPESHRPSTIISKRLTLYDGLQRISIKRHVKATYQDGILEVRIPVDRKEAEAKKVPIQRV